MWPLAIELEYDMKFCQSSQEEEVLIGSCQRKSSRFIRTEYGGDTQIKYISKINTIIFCCRKLKSWLTMFLKKPDLA